jgi:hypothetical protein
MVHPVVAESGLDRIFMAPPLLTSLGFEPVPVSVSMPELPLEQL